MATIDDLISIIEPLTKILVDKRISTHGYLQWNGFFQAFSQYEFEIILKNKKLITLKKSISSINKKIKLDDLISIIQSVQSQADLTKYASVEKYSKLIWNIIDLAEKREKVEKALFRKYKKSSTLKIKKDGRIKYLCTKNYKLKFIVDLKSFLSLIEKHSNKDQNKRPNKYHNKKVLYFRGHRNLNYNIEAYVTRAPYYKNEFKIFNETQVLCSTAFEKCHSNLQTLAMMQHYEVPTRVLDISTNPLVALFFAVCSFREDFGKNLNGEVLIFALKDSQIRYDDNVRVRTLSALAALKDKDRKKIIENLSKPKYALRSNPQVKKLVKIIRKEDPEFKNKISKKLLQQCILVKPIKNNNRMLRQSGVFFVCGLSEYGSFENAKNISRYRIKSAKKKRIICIIPNQYKEHIYRELEHLKINNANLYPEIEHVAEYLREKYEE